MQQAALHDAQSRAFDQAANQSADDAKKLTDEGPSADGSSRASSDGSPSEGSASGRDPSASPGASGDPMAALDPTIRRSLDNLDSPADAAGYALQAGAFKGSGFFPDGNLSGVAPAGSPGSKIGFNDQIVDLNSGGPVGRSGLELFSGAVAQGQGTDSQSADSSSSMGSGSALTSLSQSSDASLATKSLLAKGKNGGESLPYVEDLLGGDTRARKAANRARSRQRKALLTGRAIASAAILSPDSSESWPSLGHYLAALFSSKEGLSFWLLLALLLLLKRRRSSARQEKRSSKPVASRIVLLLPLILLPGLARAADVWVSPEAVLESLAPAPNVINPPETNDSLGDAASFFRDGVPSNPSWAGRRGGPPPPDSCVACLFQEYNDCQRRTDKESCEDWKIEPKSQCVWNPKLKPSCVSRFKSQCYDECREKRGSGELCAVADRRRWDEVVKQLKARSCPNDRDRTRFVMRGHGEGTSVLAKRLEGCATHFGSCSLDSGGCEDARELFELQLSLMHVASSCPLADVRVQADQCVAFGSKPFGRAHGHTLFEVRPGGSCRILFPPCNMTAHCMQGDARYCTDTEGHVQCDVCTDGYPIIDSDGKARGAPGMSRWVSSTEMKACENYTGVRVPHEGYRQGLSIKLYETSCKVKCLGVSGGRRGGGIRALDEPIRFSFMDPDPKRFESTAGIPAPGDAAHLEAQLACFNKYIEKGILTESSRNPELVSRQRIAWSLSSCYRVVRTRSDTSRVHASPTMTKVAPGERDHVPGYKIKN